MPRKSRIEEQENKDTQKVLSNGTKMKHIVESEAWGEIIRRLALKLVDLRSIKNLRMTTPDEVLVDIKARNTAEEIIMEVVSEIAGEAGQHQANQEILAVENTSDYVIRF